MGLWYHKARGTTVLVNDGPRISKRLQDIWGINLRACRVDLGLSQDQLADCSKVTQQTISNIENGRGLPRDDIKIALARALGTTPGELFPWPPMEDLVA
jgi:transcriptional regulator with XRE-family HTH domain